jgi:hypothetical protein
MSKILLKQYLPKNTSGYVLDLLILYPVKFKIVKPRKSKLGDFRASNMNGNCQITVNNNLEPLNFLITTIHEIAHLYNWMEYKGKIPPHGQEWKNEYKKLFQPLLSTKYLLPEEVAILKSHLSNPKASSCSDITLTDYFRKDGFKRVEELPIGASFVLNGKTYTSEKKLRKRFLCIEQQSKRKYYVNGLAEIEEV